MMLFINELRYNKGMDKKTDIFGPKRYKTLCAILAD